MNRFLITSAFVLLVSFAANAQNSFLANIKAISPAASFTDSKYASFGFELGYSREFAHGRAGIDIAPFADFLNYKHDLPDLRQFDGTTFYAGLGISPRYCFNPEQELKFSAVVTVKGGYNYGWGIVTQTYIGADDKQIENQTVNAGFALNLAPAVEMSFPGSKTNVSLRLGYDSSNFGKGLNRLRSQYYAPINYSSGGIFLGVVLRLGRRDY
ncbi:hypothetical protein D0C36_06100 [Mucilaginibacter conchicola]|uniref:Outer membrane protein beta-barrel domain-containing protein n=1 Tax=Mucilaginibacter conchicola TaxID=2303333 RepID=A0A372NYA6_9SPHI|nr:hypothetical protein [Mucilaginibacter conchicola]RFZ95096.1 hypothetical protein D0C36_06100 [Mucilaginibacter conchicola]